MKWKDSAEIVGKEALPKEEYFDEEQYSPWADRKDGRKSIKVAKPPLLVILLSVALVVLTIVLVVLLSGHPEGAVSQSTTALEQRIQEIEDRLNKYNAVDEKVTRIWEQAQSFEKFKDRFDRSEASMSLRMDHLTLTLENLQKQVNQISDARGKQGAAPAPAAAAKPKAAPGIQYHEVAVGDTLFSISKRYGLAVESLLAMNRLGADAVIKPGQKLIVRQAASRD